MKILKLALLLVLILVVSTIMVISPSVCFAQAIPGLQSIPAVAPTSLPAGMVVVWVGSLVVGVLHYAIQSGGLFGIKTVPQPWMPYLTVASTVIGGAVSYLASQPSPVALTTSTIFFAFATGLFDLLTAGAPALAVHALHTAPAQMHAMRLAKLARVNAVDRIAANAVTLPPAAK